MRNKLSLAVIAVIGLGLLTTSSVLAQPSAKVNSQNAGANAKPCVEVHGAVRSSSHFLLDRPLRLAEAIAMAGGEDLLLRPDDIIEVPSKRRIHGDRWPVGFDCQLLLRVIN